MSNIPYARSLLEEALKHRKWALVEKALAQMRRKKPEFIAEPKFPRLNISQRARARRMRYIQRMCLGDIALALGTNIGRVSEAIND